MTTLLPARRPARDPWGPGLAAVPRTVLRPRDDVPAMLTRMYAAAVRGRGTVHVLQLTDPSACDLGVELVVAGDIAGEAVSHRDLTPGAPPPEPDALSGRSVPAGVAVDAEIVSVRRRRLDGAAITVLKEARTAVLVVEIGRTPPAVADHAARMLGFLGVEVRGLVAWRGRLPRDPSWALR